MRRLAIVIALLGSVRATGCMCVGDFGMCHGFKSADTAIFVGRVTAIKIDREVDIGRFHTQRVTFAIREAFRSGRGKKVTVTSPWGDDCSFEFRLRESYLLYVSRDGGRYVAGGCNRILRVDAAGDEIAHLRRLALAPPGAAIVGTLKTYAADRNFMSRANSPLAGCKITLDGPLGAHVVATDKDGRYSVVGLPPGLYRLSVTLPDDYLPAASPDVTLERDGCAEVDLRASRKPDQAGKAPRVAD